MRSDCKNLAYCGRHSKYYCENKCVEGEKKYKMKLENKRLKLENKKYETLLDLYTQLRYHKDVPLEQYTEGEQTLVDKIDLIENRE